MIELRPRAEDDLPALVALLGSVQAAHGYPSAMPEDPYAFLCGQRLIGSWVALVGGEVAGQVSLASAPGDRAVSTWTAALGRDEAELAVIKRLFVSPAHERRGIGRRLLRAAVAGAHERGLWPVLDVVSSSGAALLMYKAEGFELVGEITMSWPGSGGPLPVSCLTGPPPPGRAGR